MYQEGENAYEQPFTNETLPSDASIPGAFTVAAHSSIDPYSNLAEAGYEFPSANGKVCQLLNCLCSTFLQVPAARKNTRDYEVPVEKLSPNDANPRYVDFSDVVSFISSTLFILFANTENFRNSTFIRLH